MNAVLVVAGIMQKDGMIFAAQRNAKAHQALKWEFPGGKVEINETPEKALERELFEELGVKTVGIESGYMTVESLFSLRKVLNAELLYRLGYLY